MIINIYKLNNYFKYIYYLNSSSKKYNNNLLLNINEINSIDIITIAFNNEKLIEFQIKALKKNITDHFYHIVADNSNNNQISLKIENVCRQFDVFYIKIPDHKYTRNKSHGYAMHWVYKNVIRKRNNQYFGFIDHDIFPTQKYSVIEKLQNGIYGRVIHAYKPEGYIEAVSDSYPYWSLWAGFFFLRADLLSRQNIYSFDFNPLYFRNGVFLDTAGGLWKSLYKNLDYPGNLATFKQLKFRESKTDQIQSDYYELIDNWVHFVNLSFWSKIDNVEEKLEFIYSYLTDMLSENNNSK